MKNLFEKEKRRKELKNNLKNVRNDLHNFQRTIDSINEELDLIYQGKLHTNQEYVGTLLQRKLKVQQNIVGAVEVMVNIERELKGLI